MRHVWWIELNRTPITEAFTGCKKDYRWQHAWPSKQVTNWQLKKLNCQAIGWLAKNCALLWLVKVSFIAFCRVQNLESVLESEECTQNQVDPRTIPGERLHLPRERLQFFACFKLLPFLRKQRNARNRSSLISMKFVTCWRRSFTLIWELDAWTCDIVGCFGQFHIEVFTFCNVRLFLLPTASGQKEPYGQNGFYLLAIAKKS